VLRSLYFVLSSLCVLRVLCGEKKRLVRSYNNKRKTARRASFRTSGRWCFVLVGAAASGRRTAIVLVGQNHFVQIGRDRDLVVFEVGQPGAFAADRVGQQGENIAQRDRNDVLAVRRFGDRAVRFALGTVIHAKLASGHETFPYVGGVVEQPAGSMLHCRSGVPGVRSL